MKPSKIIIPLLTILFFLQACENSSKESTMSETTTSVSQEEISADAEAPISSTAATYQSNDRKFVRTADLSMEVKNVYQSTTQIESKISQLGGFVTESNLESRILSETIYPVSSDSSREVRKYLVNNNLRVRVPQQELGSFLIGLGEEMEFLNYRNIKANDVNLELLLSSLEQERLKKTNNQLDEITQEKGKIGDKQEIIENISDKRLQINDQKLNKLKLKDEIAFSTVTIQLSEKEKIAEKMVINLKNYDDKYRPDFWYSAGNSLKDGFQFFQSICIGLLYIWPLWIIGVLVYFVFKYLIKTRKTAKL